MADYLQPSFPVFYAICVCVDIITNMPSVCACSPLLCHLNVTGGPFKFYLKNSTWLCIFFQILLEKVLKKWYLLAESWFWLCIFSAQILLETVLKIKTSKLLVESWFWLLLFPFQILLQKTVEKLNFVYWTTAKPYPRHTTGTLCHLSVTPPNVGVHHQMAVLYVPTDAI